MLFISIIILIICKALINDKLSEDFYHRISAIILLFAGLLSYNGIYNLDSITGIGIYSGLFNITNHSQILESFLLIIGSIILVSWPKQEELIIEVKNPILPTSYNTLLENSYLYSLLNSILLENYNKNKSVDSSAFSVQLINYSILNNNKFVSHSINYSIIVLFSSLGASLLISCSDLISMYLSIELQSFSLYVLSTLYRDSELSTSAGLKYFLLGALASCLILFGAGLLYAYTGLTNFESIYSLLSIYNIEINNNFIDIIYPFFSKELSGSIFLGLIFIFVGFLIKISAAPFHNWSPDVYDDTPTIVTIWLTIIPKISILILLLDLYLHIDLIDQLTLFGQLNGFKFNIDQLIKYLLLITSLLSLIIGSVVGLAQNRIKRLLAYSTISHIGFILLALAIHSKQSIDSFIFYIIQYIITNLNIFLIIIAFSYLINNNIKDIRYISEFKGQFFLNPLISLSFSICLFSMAGIPPLIGFFSKQYVLYSAIQSGYNFIALIAIVVSVISASYYLKIIKTFFWSNSATEHSSLEGYAEKSKELEENLQFNLSAQNGVQVNNKLSNLHSFLISTLTLSILFFIFKPSLILNTTQLLSISLFNQ
uniref:NADH dehydrogenase subunit 2 n=1 Tax=Moniliophthora perniciosa TaxID=153609 RepID=UPI0000242369|nr:NADH dehydrogenase subunit 2 [Moniliophthora perniciosa]AAQ74265.1 NADH dehydrogenase subunit 2 [Moniliophthora perniciosa]